MIPAVQGASPEPGEGYRCYRIDQKLALLSPLTRLARARHPLPTSRGEGVERVPGASFQLGRRPFGRSCAEGNDNLRCHRPYKLPFVDGTAPPARGSGSAACRSARARPLKQLSMMWWWFSP
jgi:hypothetical protein